MPASRATRQIRPTPACSAAPRRSLPGLELSDGNTRLASGSTQLATGAGRLADGNARIAEGTGTLYSSQPRCPREHGGQSDAALALGLVGVLGLGSVGAYRR